jgi:pimeloyl-ACP methyl ester carboxylesterase
VFAGRWAENDPKAYLATLRAIVGWSVAEHLEKIALPTLVIAADEDYTPVAAKEAYVGKMQQADLVVIEDSRHGTPIERPEEFNEVVRTFLK